MEVDNRTLREKRLDYAIRILTELTGKRKHGTFTGKMNDGHIVDFKWEISFDQFKDKNS